MSQDGLAAEVKMTGNAISMIETGATKRPYASTLLKIARATGFDTWEALLARHAVQPSAPNGHADMIPVLTTIPASFGADGDVAEAYDFEEAIDYLPGSFRDAQDPRMFGLVVQGDSMASRYADGDYVACSPKHWLDHGFADGFCYAVRLKTGETTVKRVHLIDDGQRLELAPINPAHPTQRVDARDVDLAALVRGSYMKEPMPG